MPKLTDVNTTDLSAALALGCRTMQSCFDADDDLTPFFDATVEPYAALAFSPNLSDCHLPGRHLNALLTAEAVAGISVDLAAIANLRRTLMRSFSGPLCLPLNRLEQSGPVRVFSAHNLREGLHALYALVRYRGDTEAAALAERYFAEINRLWSPAAGWDVPAFERLGLIYQPVQGPVNGEARMIGPLVKYARATGSPAAVELALRLKDVCVERHFGPDGAYSKERLVTDHTHSITGTLSSLAQLADYLDDAALLERVRAFYDVGMWAIRDEIGWTGGAAIQPESDHGEAGNCGDLIEVALILGRRLDSAYYADAERMLRCHLLPSQLRDVSWMRLDPRPNPPDGLRDAANRMRGAWGMPAPYGHWAVGQGRDTIGYYMDIVGSVVGSLCAAREAAVAPDGDGQRVNLLFDHESPGLRLTVLDEPAGLEVLIQQPGPLWLRLPPWVAPADVSVAGPVAAPVAVAVSGSGYLFFAQPPVGQPFQVRYPLPETTLTLSERVHGHPIRLRLRGDRPVAMDNYGADLTFFEPF